jgi:PAS domain S-box-containing protein
MVGSMMDITERKRAHEALAARERQLLEAQHLARLGSWEWDARTEAITWSEEMYRLHGVSAETFQPTVEALRAMVDPDDRDLARRMQDRCITERRPVAFDLRLRCPDGRLRIFHCRGQPVTDADGRVRRIVGTSQDVTDRRRTEERLRDSQRQLRTLTAHREAIIEAERARISREIHDELGEILTASKLDLAWIRDSLPAAPGRIRERLDDLAARLDATIKTVRRIATELRPVVLDQLGLAAATEWQARDFAHRTGIACSSRCDLDERHLPRETVTALFRILQEALTNIARHAGATIVRVDLHAVGDTICLEVTDDGRGIGAGEANDAAGLGILGMRERALLLGGALELSSLEPSGTRLSVWAPLSVPA